MSREGFFFEQRLIISHFFDFLYLIVQKIFS